MKHTSCMDACTNIVCAAKGNKGRRIITCYGLTAMGIILSTPDQIRYKSVWTQRICTIYHIPHHPHHTTYTHTKPNIKPHHTAPCARHTKHHTTLHHVPHHIEPDITTIPHYINHTRQYIPLLYHTSPRCTRWHQTSPYSHITSHQTTPKHTPHHLEP